MLKSILARLKGAGEGSAPPLSGTAAAIAAARRTGRRDLYPPRLETFQRVRKFTRQGERSPSGGRTLVWTGRWWRGWPSWGAWSEPRPIGPGEWVDCESPAAADAWRNDIWTVL